MLIFTIYIREATESMSFVVRAYDGGQPSLSDTATITVMLIDENDQKPTFSKSEYRYKINNISKCGLYTGCSEVGTF